RFGHLDPHESELEAAVDQRFVELPRALHLLHARAHLFLSERRDGVAEHQLLVGELRQRRTSGAKIVVHTAGNIPLPADQIAPSNTCSASSTLPNGADTRTPCISGRTCSNI